MHVNWTEPETGGGFASVAVYFLEYGFPNNPVDFIPIKDRNTFDWEKLDSNTMLYVAISAQDNMNLREGDSKEEFAITRKSLRL